MFAPNSPLLAGPFLGTEALSTGRVRKHRLRSEYSALFPGVYFPSDGQPTFAQRAEAAWLWSHRRGVIAGCTAARLHGALWVDDALPIELFWVNARTPRGIATSAVARLDALANAVSFDSADVLELAARHRGVRGVRQVATVLELSDSGAQSPRETWLRLVLLRGGFPRPRTQIPVTIGGYVKYYLDMGWEDVKVAVEYDGDQHRTDRVQFAKDVVRLEELADLGWIVVRVVAGTSSADVVRRVRRAWDAHSPSTLR